MSFVHPRSLNLKSYREVWPKANYMAFDDAVFASRLAYNSWILRPHLYQMLHEFDYVLIAQTDAVLMRLPNNNMIESFDYWGASWNPPLSVVRGLRNRLYCTQINVRFGRQLVVGNGGISLRRTSVFAQPHLLPTHNPRVNEDVHIAYFGQQNGRVKIAPKALVDTVFVESAAKGMLLHEVQNVCGFHALNIFNPGLERNLLAEIIVPPSNHD